MTEEPLIYTTRGNMPISGLTYRHEWQEDDNAIVFIEQYYLGDELVKSSSHVKIKKGLDLLNETSEIG